MRHANELTELREKYNRLVARMAALLRAMDARRTDARALIGELEAAALAGDDEKVQEYTEALRALDRAFASDRAALDDVKAKLEEMAEAIDEYYAQGKKVDWTLRLVPGKLYDDWSKRWSDGVHAIVEGAELTDVEIRALERYHLKNCDVYLVEGGRLKVRQPVYRRVVFQDLDGRVIVKHLRRILPLSPKAARALEVVKDLEVLR